MRTIILVKESGNYKPISVHHDLSQGKQALLEIAQGMHSDNVTHSKGVFSYEKEELFYKHGKTSFRYGNRYYSIVGLDALKTLFQNKIPEEVTDMIIMYYPNFKF